MTYFMIDVDFENPDDRMAFLSSLKDRTVSRDWRGTPLPGRAILVEDPLGNLDVHDFKEWLFARFLPLTGRREPTRFFAARVDSLYPMRITR